MKKLISLVRAGLKSNFSFLLPRHYSLPKKKNMRYLFLIVLGLAGFGSLLYLLLGLIKFLFRILQPIGQQSALLTLAIIAGQLLVLILGLFYIISAFYFSRDLQILIPLPFKPSQVILSKFFIVLTNEYLSLSFFLLPVFFYFGLLDHSPFSYWILIIPVYLLLPVIPLAIASVLAICLMRLVNLSRKKDLLILVGSLLLIVGQFFFQVRLSHSRIETQSQELIQFFTSPESLMNQVGAKFPPSLWASKILIQGFSTKGLSTFALLSAVSLLFFYGLVVLGEKLFYRGLIGLQEISAKVKKLTAQQMAEKISSGFHPVRAVFWREVKVMNRTPIFLLNGLLAVILIPLLLLISIKTQSGQSISFLTKFISAERPLFLILGSSCFFILCACLSGTASSTFSREGRHFWISKVIPVPPRFQVMAKFWHSYLVSILGIIAAALVLVFSFKLRIVDYSLALLQALIISWTLTALNMVIDLSRPLLNWTNPQKAIKQNVNVFLSLLLNIVFLVFMAALIIILINLKISDRLIYSLLLLLNFCLAYIAFRFLLDFAQRRYAQIEV